MADIEVANELRESAAIDGLVLELGTSVLLEPAISAEVFQGLTSLLMSPSFLALEDSWKLIYFLDTNWERVTSVQQIALLPVLEDTFRAVADPTGSFLVGEMLAKHYEGDTAFRVLAALGRESELRSRASVPHGLETLARGTPNPSVRALACAELERLAGSAHQEVREEAKLALRKVSR